MQLKLVIFFALMAVSLARPDRLGYGEHHDSSEEEEEERSYEFEWKVEEKDDDSEELNFGHTEKKEDGRVEGYFYVLLPDTRLQKVNYYVDGDSGFVADVSYEGEAEFDDQGDDHDDSRGDDGDDDDDDDRQYRRY